MGLFWFKVQSYGNVIDTGQALLRRILRVGVQSGDITHEITVSYTAILDFKPQITLRLCKRCGAVLSRRILRDFVSRGFAQILKDRRLRGFCGIGCAGFVSQDFKRFYGIKKRFIL